MNNFIWRFFLFYCIPFIVMAAEKAPASPSPDAPNEGLGFGKVMTNMLSPVSVLSDFINTACFAIGGSFLFASVIKYIEHRRSPLMVPISTVIFLFFMGVLLILLPFLSLFIDTGMPSSLLKNMQ